MENPTVYLDVVKFELYVVAWYDTGNNEIPRRIYFGSLNSINNDHIMEKLTLKIGEKWG